MTFASRAYPTLRLELQLPDRGPDGKQQSHVCYTANDIKHPCCSAAVASSQNAQVQFGSNWRRDYLPHFLHPGRACRGTPALLCGRGVKDLGGAFSKSF